MDDGRRVVDSRATEFLSKSNEFWKVHDRCLLLLLPEGDEYSLILPLSLRRVDGQTTIGFVGFWVGALK